MRISRKMNFKEITSIQGSSSSAHGRAQAPLLPRKQDLSVEHLLAPAVVSIPGAGSRQTLQNRKNAGNEALEEDSSLQSAVL